MPSSRSCEEGGCVERRRVRGVVSCTRCLGFRSLESKSFSLIPIPLFSAPSSQRLRASAGALIPQLRVLPKRAGLSQSPRMDSVIYPRSPREQMDGWVYLPRFVDKIRLHLAGRLSKDYEANFAHGGFDAKWLEAAGLRADDFIAVVRETVTDGQVCDWVRRHVTRTATEKDAFNQHVLNRGREENDPALRDRLRQRKAESGFAHRDDIQTFVDYIDADEKRL